MFKYSIFNTVEAYSWATQADHAQYLVFHKALRVHGRELSAKSYNVFCELMDNSLAEDMAVAAAGDFGKIDIELNSA